MPEVNRTTARYDNAGVAPDPIVVARARKAEADRLGRDPGYRTGPTLTISVEFLFEAAHFLPNHDGKCRNLHGHSYKLQIEVSGRVMHDGDSPKDGMVVDFGPLKDHIKEIIWARLDHKCINNDLPEIGTPTAENMVLWIYQQMTYGVIPNLPEITLEAVRLWETSTTMVEIRR